MRHQRLNSVVVEGFTSIRSAELPLHDLNVLVGANGAGKSNFIRALGLLGRIVDSELSLFVGVSGGANALLSIDQAVPRLIRLKVESYAGSYTAELVPAAGIRSSSPTRSSGRVARRWSRHWAAVTGKQR
jgi:predicted ATPase